ncbi:beta-ketoacyl-[acyl-carrier-protein] synthase family protein [Calycomorphotria hydatis]|nr:beta-ketoacyl synthase N-terminal-like domain-containing protein [Calycomorphotria hydatis]
MSSENNSPAVVITGLGLVSPFGVGHEVFAQHLASGDTGIHRAEQMAFGDSLTNFGGEAAGFSDTVTKEVMPKKQRKFVKVMCREIELGVVSALTAFEDSGIDNDSLVRSRMGVDFGANLMFSPPDQLKDAAWECLEEGDASRKFNYDRWGGDGLRVMEPLWLLKYLPNMPACHIGIALDAQGPSNSLTLNEVSALMAISEAQGIIKRGRADIMIAGVTGTRLHPIKAMHASLWDELAHGDESDDKLCKPFDKNRTGQVIGEGAGSIILESKPHAEARGAKIYGELLAVGSSCAAKDGSPDHRTALANSMKAALTKAGLKPSDIGHINANATGSVYGDAAEAAAIQDVFGKEHSDVLVTAPKSFLGNSGSGCGILELAASLLALKEGFVPKTLNFSTADPDCPVNVAQEKLPSPGEIFLTTNITRAGQAAAAIVRVG